MRVIYFLAAALLSLTAAQAQDRFGQIQNLIPRDKTGINQFDVKKDTVEFKGLSIDLGAAFALQFQGVKSFNDHNYAPGQYRLNNLENNFNLPTANMTIGAQLYDGVRVNLDLYLAARHHNETWVKGGYLQIDKLDFIQKDFLKDFMKYATIKIGQMENNYGDAHFRRSDNGNALMNPFVGNNIMDAFTTEMGAELYYNRNGWVSMIGVTNSKLNQNVKEIVPAAPGRNTTISPTIIAKLGYDKQLNDDLRVRLTGSVSHVANSSGNLYSSDRAGSRFYGVMTHATSNFPVNGNNVAIADNFDPTSNYTTGRFNPAFGNWATSYMINPFVKYKGLEVFGTIEIASGGNKQGDETKRTVNQYVGDVVYRFGTNEKFYVGAKYNLVSGKLANADIEKININRFEAAAGWFMTKNILAKVEYVNQNYKNFSEFNANGTPNDFYGGKFNGVMFEAVITF
ncbi:conserved exported hypothetical protein [Flavobacterium sp. 9R]|uniref:hypothetical protein n=1 Tax=Flavobacterium sp. 9R TaxID=2653143 RepID=UPI0012F01A27|nr:hypothetical protein [Flavobacterium sp. 9R]VXB49832.1 conserved exported hypothetical protein [Flavobacterium sp. 9R]